jgi:hypothetical protein
MSETGTSWFGCGASDRDAVSQTDKCLDILPGALKQVRRRAPLVRFAKHNDAEPPKRKTAFSSPSLNGELSG